MTPSSEVATSSKIRAVQFGEVVTEIASDLGLTPPSFANKNRLEKFLTPSQSFFAMWTPDWQTRHVFMLRAMSVLSAAVFFSFSPTAGYALTLLEKHCVVLASENLPKIPGMTVVRSRVTPARFAEGVDPGDMTLLDVQLDTLTAGMDITHKFVCVSQGDFAFVEYQGVAP